MFSKTMVLDDSLRNSILGFSCKLKGFFYEPPHQLAQGENDFINNALSSEFYSAVI